MSRIIRTYQTTIDGQLVTVKVYKSSSKGQLVIEDAGEELKEYDPSADTEPDLYDILNDQDKLQEYDEEY